MICWPGTYSAISLHCSIFVAIWRWNVVGSALLANRATTSFMFMRELESEGIHVLFPERLWSSSQCGAVRDKWTA